jgi:hypothetical protein
VEGGTRDGGVPGDAELPPADASEGGRDSDGGVADDGGFTPCPSDGGACIVLPFGDSITDGIPFEAGGYRVEIFHQAVSGAQRITFVGTLANGPANVDGRPFPRSHEGHSGFTIDNAPAVGRQGISPLADGVIAMFHPNIVLLMIGTNDIDQNFDVANAPTRLGALIDRITNDAPDALLVVARLTPTGTDSENVKVQAYNAAIPGLVAPRVAAGKHIAVVDMYAAFTANANFKTALLSDNLHPNDAGYALMGDTWYAAIRGVLR